MATLLRMPEVAANATHAILAAWNKKEGEAVAVGDCLADVETDKAVVELSAEAAGVVGKLLVAAGQEIEVGAPIAVLLAPGENGFDVATSVAAAGGSAPSPMQAAPANPAGRVFASPLARRLGGQRKIDLARLRGSGPNGRIVKRDVDAASAIGQEVASAPARQPGAVADDAPNRAYCEVPHSNMRRTIARRLFESKSTIPHFYLAADCRMDRLLALRAEINAAAPRKISVNDFIVRAVAVALRDVPGANVGWTETAMRHYAHADIAVAVSTDTGLLTPIVRNADSKPLSVISAEIADLAARARAGQLRPEEYQGGGFSVSNLGMYGVAEFSAIINPPQAAILAVGATQQLPVVDSGVLAVGTVMRCTLSVDHRAIDGALAGEWLAAFKHVIEAPLAMLV